MFKILNNKRADATAGAMICIIIITAVISLMQITYMLNTHYQTTRAFEHSMVLLETKIQKDVYQGLSNYNIYTFRNQLPSSLELKEEYIKLLQKNANFEYDYSKRAYVGNGFSIPENSVTVRVVDTGYAEGRFYANFEVHAIINYTIDTFLSSEPRTITTGNIKFTSSYKFVEDYTPNSDYSIGNDADSDKYNDQ